MKKLLATTAIISMLSTSAFAGINSNNGNTTNNPTASADALALSGAQAGASIDSKIKSNIDNEVNVGTQDFNAVLTKNEVKKSGNSDVDVNNIGLDIDASRTSNKQSNKQSTKTNTSDSNEINIGGAEYIEAKNPVNTAYAPTVIATSDCLGSVSGGGQGSSFGATLGFTTNSEPCNIREDAKLVAALTKDESLVKATLCQSDRVKEAYKVTGEYNKYCVGAKATVKTSFWGLNKTSAYEERDVCAYPTPACKASKR